MGRPYKIGLDYFPLNVDMDDEDQRIFMMECAFEGERAFGLLIKLLMTIYRNGYYYPWTEKECSLFARKKNIDLEYCKRVVSFLVKEGFFDKNVYEKYRVLTSKGIQKRYFEIVKRRDKIEIVKQFYLLKNKCIHHVDRNVVFVDINSIDDDTNLSYADINRVSAIRKERKEKQSKHNRVNVDINSQPSGCAASENTPLQKPKDQQLADLADMLRTENPDEYQKLLKKHPELADFSDVLWETEG